MVVASLSGKICLGYLGLRAIPSFDEALGTVQKDYKVPIPDRRARWYANSVYRSYILDAAEKLHNQEEESLEYKKLGYEAPDRSGSTHHPEGTSWERSVFRQNAGPQ